MNRPQVVYFLSGVLAYFPSGATTTQAPPRLEDYPVVLRVGKGALPDRTPLELLTRACNQGWLSGCGDLGVFYVRGEGTQRDVQRAAVAFNKACNGGLAVACSNLGYMHYNADGVPRDEAKGLAYLKQACDMGYSSACRWMKDIVR